MKCKIRQRLTNSKVKEFGDTGTGYYDVRWVVVVLIAVDSNEGNLGGGTGMQSEKLDNIK